MEEHRDKLIDIVFSKLTQIMHDMLSFDVPVSEIKQLISRYIRHSKFIGPDLQRDILMRLAMEEKKEAASRKSRVVLDSNSFDHHNSFAESDRRSKFFHGLEMSELDILPSQKMRNEQSQIHE
jgi:hypothetical protein